MQATAVLTMQLGASYSSGLCSLCSWMHACLQADCNRVVGKPCYRELKGEGSVVQQAEEAEAYARSWHDSAIDDLFGGVLQSTLQCHKCMRQSHCFDPFFDLSLPIPSKPSISVQVRQCSVVYRAQHWMGGSGVQWVQHCSVGVRWVQHCSVGVRWVQQISVGVQWVQHCSAGVQRSDMLGHQWQGAQPIDASKVTVLHGRGGINHETAVPHNG